MADDCIDCGQPTREAQSVHANDVAVPPWFDLNDAAFAIVHVIQLQHFLNVQGKTVMTGTVL